MIFCEDGTSSLTESQRSALLLRIWEAISAERELPGVLAALADLLQPLVATDGIGIIKAHDHLSTHEQADPDVLFALHVAGLPRIEGEPLEHLLKRTEGRSQPLDEVRPKVDYPPLGVEAWLSGTPCVCDDLLAKEGWFDHEFHLARGGIRSYVSVPLIMRGQVIGVAVFFRHQVHHWGSAALQILRDISRALATAVANALANEEIRGLRDQLEAENISLRAQLGQSPWFEEIIADSTALKRVLEAVEQVALTDATVLITGETGTGKELVARAIHRRSARARGPFIKVNCAAVPESLIASELFGHERGAFTGAVERRKGRFEQAHGGTLLLDEIGELSPAMQVMLLRVLQEREFERLGGTQTLRVDVRLVTATNRNLADEVRQGRFRSDLYYRLNVFPVHVPPLRERPEDVPPLVAHFAEKHGTRFKRKITRIDRRALGLLQRHAWPGNVRELENVVERAVILARNGTLKVEPGMLGPADWPGTMSSCLRSQEREAIEAALRAAGGKVSGDDGAAKRLGLAASTLEFRIKRLGVDKFQFRRR